MSVSSHSIIYTLIDSIKDKLSSLLPAKFDTFVNGEASVLQLFSINSKKNKQEIIGGCKITNGKVLRNSIIRVMRGGEQVYKGYPS